LLIQHADRSRYIEAERIRWIQHAYRSRYIKAERIRLIGQISKIGKERKEKN
jgi:hypothetical protein